MAESEPILPGVVDISTGEIRREHEVVDINSVTEMLGAIRIDRHSQRTGEVYAHMFLFPDGAKRRVDGTPVVPRLEISRESGATFNDGNNPSYLIEQVSALIVSGDRLIIQGEDDYFYRSLEVSRDGTHATINRAKYDEVGVMLSDRELNEVVEGASRYFK